MNKELRERTSEDNLGDEYADLEIYEDYSRLKEVLDEVDEMDKKFIAWCREVEERVYFKLNLAENDACRVLRVGLETYQEQLERAFFNSVVPILQERADHGEAYRNGEDGFWYLGKRRLETRDDGGGIQKPKPDGVEDPTELLEVNDHGNISFQYWDGDKWVEQWSCV